VITDWLLPDLSGTELCQRLRKDFGDAPIYIILATAVSEEAKIAEGLEAGADDYLTKPFHTKELRERIENGLKAVAIDRTTGLAGNPV
jgi:DNA-binding response OmpR family regulator